MKKKMLSLALAATMLIGASMTALADDAVTTLGSNSEAPIEMTASVEIAVISVTVAANGTDITANPYGLDVTVGDETVTDTLIGDYITFTNGSNVPIEVGLTGTITLAQYDDTVAAADRVTIATKAPTGATTTKQVYVQGEIFDKVGDGGVKLVDAKGKVVAPFAYSAKGGSISTKPVLAKAGYDTTAENAVKTAKEEMVLVISGSTSVCPTSEWKTDDAFTVSTVYDLRMATTPSAFEAPQTPAVGG